MPNVVYDNFFLSNEIEDQFNSMLDLQGFCTIDNSLTGAPGMTRVINTYRATDGVEKLEIGAGNSGSIEVSYTPKEYKIQLAQGNFKWQDEQAMTDPNLVPVGVRHIGVNMFNTVNDDVFAEFNKATHVVVTNTLGFDCFADAQAAMNLENIEGTPLFAFVNPADVATLRKALKDTLQYVEAFARQGYIGSVAGINVFAKKDAVKGTICIANQEAVTVFNKVGSEVEQTTAGTRSSADANTRTNHVFGRKYYIAAMTHYDKAVKVIKGSAAVSTDSTVQSGKTYYAAADTGYIAVEPQEDDNPATKGWYEITAS